MQEIELGALEAVAAGIGVDRAPGQRPLARPVQDLAVRQGAAHLDLLALAVEIPERPPQPVEPVAQPRGFPLLERGDAREQRGIALLLGDRPQPADVAAGSELESEEAAEFFAAAAFSAASLWPTMLAAQEMASHSRSYSGFST